MAISRTTLFMLGCTAATGALGVWGYAAFHEAASVAIHFDLRGNPNGRAAPAVAFAVLPLVSALLLVAHLVIERTRPAAASSRTRLGKIALIGPQIALLAAQAVILGYALTD